MDGNGGVDLVKLAHMSLTLAVYIPGFRRLYKSYMVGEYEEFFSCGLKRVTSAETCERVASRK